MPTNVSGYTGLNIDGQSSGRRGMLTGISLASAKVLTRAEAVNGLLIVTTGHAANAIELPVAIATEFRDGGRGTVVYIVRNEDAALAATIKVTGGTGIVVAATKTAIVALNAAGTDFVRVTLDA